MLFRSAGGRFGGGQGARHPRHLLGRHRGREAQAFRTGRKTGRGCGQGAARRSQQPLSPRLRTRRLQPGVVDRQGAQAGHRRKVRESLDEALALTPKQAEAHTALAVYHAEIIGKIGAMIGGLTYGAKAAEAESHIKTALKLTPDSPIAHIEHGNVLMLLHGEKKEDAAAAAYEKATKIKPLDAMEALDAAFAKSQLE